MNGVFQLQRIRSGREASTSRAFPPIPAPLAPARRAALGRHPRCRRLVPAAQQDSDTDMDLFWPPSPRHGAANGTSSANGNGNGAAAKETSPTPPSGYTNGTGSASSMNGNLSSLSDVSPSAEERQPTAAAAVAPHPHHTPAADDSDVLIEFRDVHKSFGSKHILRGASFKIRRGEAVGIIGSSGTGKSTTLRLAAGLLQPDSGDVIIKGEPRHGLLSDDDTSDKLKVGLVFQSGALFDSLTVQENVGFMLYEHSSLPTEEIEAAVAGALAKVGLSGVEAFYPSELSGGMKKRVALARAIVADPAACGSGGSGSGASTNGAAHKNGSTHKNGGAKNKDAGCGEQLIMYDEPTAGLDPVASTVIEDLIRSMHEPDAVAPGESGSAVGGITSYVVVTHQHSTIRRAVDRIIFLHEGKVVWEGSVEEFDTTDEPIVRQFASGSLQGPIIYV